MYIPTQAPCHIIHPRPQLLTCLLLVLHYLNIFDSLNISHNLFYFTDRSKAVLLLWIFYVFVLSCVCYVFVCVCLYVLYCHQLGKGWPLSSRLWCLTVSLSLSHWYPGSGVVLDCIDSWSLHPYLLFLLSIMTSNVYFLIKLDILHTELFLFDLLAISLFVQQNARILLITVMVEFWYILSKVFIINGDAI